MAPRTFSIGDRVVLLEYEKQPVGRRRFKWCPGHEQSPGDTGTVIRIRYGDMDEPRTVRVAWDNGSNDSYWVENLLELTTYSLVEDTRDYLEAITTKENETPQI